MKKNILLIMPYGSVGGMERLAFNFYNHYKDQGYTVKAIKIIQLSADIIHFGNDEIALSTKDFGEMSFIKRFWFYTKIPFLIRKIIKKNAITHSISFGDMANVFSSLSFTNEYKIASIHALKSVEFLGGDFLSDVFKFAFKSSYYFFDKVVCISEAIKKDLIEKCAFKFPVKLQVIYNPHDVKQIEHLAALSLELKGEENLFANNQVVLFLGRMSIQKAPWHLIKAFSLLGNKDNSKKLVMIGDGDLTVTNYLIELVNKLELNENVIFLGRKTNPFQYLKRAKVLALSSYYEGTPNVIVEAIATETPIVSSNCTDGIIELMSLKSVVGNEMIETESGIITPNFFKGKLNIPLNEIITEEEKIFALALQLVLSETKYKQRLMSNKNALLEKFNLENVSKQYLN
jgi:glycosyltransferase involved in cell wall biosynthesis